MTKLRKLGRRSDHRDAMLRNQVQSLLDNSRITTTLTRAKETQRMAEKMITLGKKGDLTAKRRASAYIYKKETVDKLFDEIATEYTDRSGGYTRIIKIGPRQGDGTEMAILELV